MECGLCGPYGRWPTWPGIGQIGPVSERDVARTEVHEGVHMYVWKGPAHRTHTLKEEAYKHMNSWDRTYRAMAPGGDLVQPARSTRFTPSFLSEKKTTISLGAGVLGIGTWERLSIFHKMQSWVGNLDLGTVYIKSMIFETSFILGQCSSKTLKAYISVSIGMSAGCRPAMTHDWIWGCRPACRPY